MGFILELIVLLLLALGFAVLNGFAIGGGLFILHKYMGPSEDPEAFEFTNDDQAKMKRFVALTFLHGAIAAGAVVIFGFLLHRISFYFRSPGGGWALGFILLTLQLAATYLAAKPLQKVEPKRAAILMAFTALIFIIYYPYVVSDMLR
jgi:hypothetical protein